MVKLVPTATWNDKCFLTNITTYRKTVSLKTRIVQPELKQTLHNALNLEIIRAGWGLGISENYHLFLSF